MRERPILRHSCPSLVVSVGPELAGFHRTHQRQGEAVPRL
jgi:hypothetical protein